MKRVDGVLTAEIVARFDDAGGALSQAGIDFGGLEALSHYVGVIGCEASV